MAVNCISAKSSICPSKTWCDSGEKRSARRTHGQGHWPATLVVTSASWTLTPARSVSSPWQRPDVTLSHSALPSPYSLLLLRPFLLFFDLLLPLLLLLLPLLLLLFHLLHRLISSQLQSCFFYCFLHRAAPDWGSRNVTRPTTDFLSFFLHSIWRHLISRRQPWPFT